MIIKTFLNGLLPRSKDLRKALRAYQKGNLDIKGLEEVYENEAKKYVNLQREANFSFIYDGMLKWQDQLRPLCKYEGIKEGTLIRWFETNFFYRMPVVVDKISLDGNVIPSHFSLNVLKNFENVVIPIPDPLSFAMLSENRYYAKIKDLISDLTKVIIEDLQSLDINIKGLLVLSPALFYFGIDKEDIKIYNEFLKQLKSLRKNLKIIVHFSFIKNPSLLNFLSNLEIDILSLDLCYGNRIDIIRNIPEVESISLGLIDVSTSFIEEKEYLLFEIKRIIDDKHFKELYVTNSTDLDLLPYEVAMEKINVLKGLANHGL